MPQEKWRIDSAYDYVDDLRAPELAWEFLRRNEEYKSEYKRVVSVSSQLVNPENSLSDHWGLSFRNRPRPPRSRH